MHTRMIKNLGVYDARLGVTAIKLGYEVKITTQDMHVFDPTWYKLLKKKLLTKLRSFSRTIQNKLLSTKIRSCISFLELGGEIVFEPISKELLISKLQVHPIIASLCSTYLYREERPNDECSNFRYGHFVVLNGYDPKTDKFFITDPWHSIPFSKTGRYEVKSEELITAIYLAEATYDSSIMEIYPKGSI